MRHFLSVFFAVLATVVANAQGGEQFPPLPVDSAVVYGKLPNGLTYYIRHNEYPADRASFYIAQRVGAVLEEDNQNGLAHFLEHMAFNGTKNFPGKGILTYMESVGVKFGANINAYTAQDETVYHLTDVPTYREGIVDSALLVLHDWSGFISLEAEEIDKERGVIREEWRQGNSASRRTYFKHLKNTMPGTPYANRDVIGDTAVINNFTYDALRAYYHKWYRPDLQGVIVVGDVDPKEIEAKIAEMWSDIPTHENPAERVYFPVADNAEPIVSIVPDKETTYANIIVRFRKDPLPREVRLSAAGLASGMIYWVINEVVNERLDDLSKSPDASFVMAQAFYSGETPTKDAETFYVVPKPGRLAEAYTMIMDEIEKAHRFGVTGAELERAKTNCLKAYEDSYNARGKRETEDYVSEYVRAFTDFEPIPGIEKEYELAKQVVPMINVATANEVLKGMTTGNVVISVSVAENEANVPTADALVAEYKAVGGKELAAYEEKTFDGPIVKNTPKAAKLKKETKDALFGYDLWELSNGIKVYVRPTDFKDNEILVRAVSKGGYSLCHPDDVLNAYVTDDYVSEFGLGDYNQQDLSKMLVGRTAYVRPFINIYAEGLNGDCATNDFETLMQLVYMSIAMPRYDEEAFKTTHERIRTVYTNRANDPNAAFSDTIEALFSDGKPYNPSLTLKNLDELKFETMCDIYRERFANPGDFEFIITGDFEVDSIKAAVLTWIGGLKPTKMALENYKTPDVAAPKGHITSDFEQKMESGNLSSFTYFSGQTDNSLKMRCTGRMLSDVLFMRYLEAIREDEGGSYGVHPHMSFDTFGEYGLQISFDTDPARYEELYPIIRREIEKIAKEGPLAEDFAKVRENWLKKYDEDSKQNSYWQNVLMTKLLYDRDAETEYVETVRRISADDIRAFAERVLKDDNVLRVTMRPAAQSVEK